MYGYYDSTMKMPLCNVAYHLHAIDVLSQGIAYWESEILSGRDPEYPLQQIAQNNELIAGHRQKLADAGEPTETSNTLLPLLFP